MWSIIQIKEQFYFQPGRLVPCRQLAPFCCAHNLMDILTVFLILITEKFILIGSKWDYLEKIERYVRSKLLWANPNRAPELIPRLLVLVSWDCQEVSYLHVDVRWYLNGSYLLNILSLRGNLKRKAASGKTSPALWRVFRLSHIVLKKSKRPPKGVLVLSLKAVLGYRSDGPQPNVHFTQYHRSGSKAGKRDVSLC